MHRLLIPLAAVFAIVVAFLLLPVRDWLGAAQAHVEALGGWGPPAVAAAYALLAVALVPGSVLALAAAALFDVWTGFAVVTIGSNLGAFGTFLAARTLLRRRAEEVARAHPRFAAVDAAVAAEGVRIVTLLRMVPGIPFPVLNVLLGISRVRPRDYLIGTLIGMLPATALFVSLGSLGGAATRAVTGLERAFQVAGVLAGATAMALVARAARRALPRLGRAPDRRAAAPASGRRSPCAAARGRPAPRSAPRRHGRTAATR